MSDDDERRRSEQERFVEEFGVYLEDEGHPRMAGRILGWLLICDPPRQSASDLAEALQASRGSISSMTQHLIRFGLIERIGVPGERQDYYQVRLDAGTNILQEGLDVIRSVDRIFDRGLRLVADQPPEGQARLREFHDFYAFLARELPPLLERWERERGRRDGFADGVMAAEKKD
jgi:DNA-binding MarR family transcriptional regulator